MLECLSQSFDVVKFQQKLIYENISYLKMKSMNYQQNLTIQLMTQNTPNCFS